MFNARCYFCHGYSGDARTVAATYLDPPPRDFTRAHDLTAERIGRALRHGRAGTAMKSFAGILDAAEIDAVTAFILEAFGRCGKVNTRYHTAENGWPDHAARNGAAFAFVTGALAADAPAAALSAEERAGLGLFRRTCGVCHEGRTSPPDAATTDAGPAAGLFRRLASASDPAHEDGAPGEHREDHDEDEEYGRGYAHDEDNPHDRIPLLSGLSEQQTEGRDLYQRACALCHAADGTGQNWIGGFLDPSPPDFTDPGAAARLDDGTLKEAILDGLRGTSMPAFRSALDDAQVEAIIAYMRRAFVKPGP